jgi:hypothetical protein
MIGRPTMSGNQILFGLGLVLVLAVGSLTLAELDRQFDAGARIVRRNAEDVVRAADTPTEVLLFAVTDDGQLSIAADRRPPDVRAGATVIVLALDGSTDAAAGEEGATAEARASSIYR